MSCDDVKSSDTDEPRDLDIADDVKDSCDTEGPRDVIKSGPGESGDGIGRRDAETGSHDDGPGPKDTVHSCAPKEDDKT